MPHSRYLIDTCTLVRVFFLFTGLAGHPIQSPHTTSLRRLLIIYPLTMSIIVFTRIIIVAPRIIIVFTKIDGIIRAEVMRAKKTKG